MARAWSWTLHSVGIGALSALFVQRASTAFLAILSDSGKLAGEGTSKGLDITRK
jgi:hypothetical protein